MLELPSPSAAASAGCAAAGAAAAGAGGGITKADLEKLIAAAKETAPAQTIRVEQGPIKIVTDQPPYKM